MFNLIISSFFCEISVACSWTCDLYSARLFYAWVIKNTFNYTYEVKDITFSCRFLIFSEDLSLYCLLFSPIFLVLASAYTKFSTILYISSSIPFIFIYLLFSSYTDLFNLIFKS